MRRGKREILAVDLFLVLWTVVVDCGCGSMTWLGLFVVTGCSIELNRRFGLLSTVVL